jgi:protein phosphatase
MLIAINKDILSATDTGLVRAVNEDSYAVAETPNGILCVVCDGMGGHAGGATASRIAVDSIVQFLSKEKYTDAQQALTEALDFANLQIIGTASENSELKGMGTTACILLVQNDCVWLVHVGDSRIYLYMAKEKRLHRLTKDHSYVQGLVDQGIITEAEAENHPNKNRILKALGVKENLEAEVGAQAIHPAKGDIFLICSDGLSNMVSDKQIEVVLSDKSELKQKEATLMALAKAAGGLDNITFQLVHISKSPHKRSVFESKNPAERKQEQKKPLWIKGANILSVVVASLVVLLLALVLLFVWKGGHRATPLDDSQEQVIDSLQIHTDSLNIITP